MADRIQLNENDIEDVVGGAFNWYYNTQGSYLCGVDGVGLYEVVSSSAKDRYKALKLQHKLDKWSASQYVDVLVSEGLFRRSNG